MIKPVLYATSGHGRAAHVALAMQEGFKRHGIVAPIVTTWRGQVEGDVAVAYGWIHEPVFTATRAAGGAFVYWDLGYWNREPSKDKGGSREGAYRLGLNSWDTADTMRRNCPADRFEAAGIVLQERPHGADQVLVIGMSEKAAGTHGFRPGQWESQMHARLRELGTGLNVIMRPKSKMDQQPIELVLRHCMVAVMHHSNVAVDALIQGVPVFAKKGVGRLVSRGDIEYAGSIGWDIQTIETRRRLLQDIAYAQWTPAEMRTGAAWDHIKGLI